MERELADFFSGITNVARIPMIVSREIAPNGAQYLRIRADDESLDSDFSFRVYYDPIKRAQTAPPKHIGGKKPYVRLMLQELRELLKQEIKGIEGLIGFLALLSDNIEWGTGHLVKGRNKRSLQYKDLQIIFACGKRKLDRILADLKKYDLLSHTKEGYFVSNRLIKRGRVKTD